MTNSDARIGWIVDVQNDFMRPDGRLYVKDLDDPDDPGARKIVDEIVEFAEWVEEHCDLVVYTGDWHDRSDDEIDEESPDPASGTYPPHCLGRSDDPQEREGAEIIREIRPSDPVVLSIDADADEAERVAEAALRESRPVFIHKVRFDVFVGNPATEALLEAVSERLGDLSFVVGGVARDVCVTQAVDGMQERGYPVTVVKDATWGLGQESEEETIDRWKSRGARIVTTGELVTGS